MASNLGALLVRLVLDDDDFDLETPRQALERFGEQLDNFANAVEGAFVGAIKAVTAATVGLVSAAAVVGANFEAEMTQVGVIAGAVGDDFDRLEDKARELGASTAFSATEAAGAMGLLAGAGLGVNEILTATGNVLTLAGAGGTDLETSAAALVSTLAQFQLEASEAARVSDVFAQVTAASQFRVEDLAQAMKYGGVVGAGFKWSLEETVAALAMFRDLGLEGSLAGTALRSAMVGAANSSAKNVEVLGKYGLTLAEVSPDTLTFAQILENVGKAGMSTSDAMVIFGSEAGAAFNSLAQSAATGSTRYQELVTSLESAAGASATMYGAMQNNVMGTFKQLQSGVEEGLLTLFDSFSAPLGRLLAALIDKVGVVVEYFRANSEGITESLERQTDAVIGWLDQNQQVIAQAFARGAQAVVALTGALGSLIPLLDEVAIITATIFVAKKVLDFGMAFGTVVSGVRAMVSALMAANVTLSIASGGTWALVLALGAVISGITLLVIGTDDLVGGLGSVSQVVGVDLVSAFTRAQAILEELGAGFFETFGGFQAPLDRINAAVQPLIVKLASMISIMFGDGVNLEPWHLFGRVLGTIADALVTKVARGFEVVAALMDISLSIWRPVNASMSLFIQGLTGIATGSTSAGNGLMQMVTAVTGAVISTVNAVFQLTAGGVELLLRTVTGALAGLPGVDAFLDSTGSLGANALAKARESFESEVTRSIISIGGLTVSLDKAEADVDRFGESIIEAGDAAGQTYGAGGLIDQGIGTLIKGVGKLTSNMETGAHKVAESWQEAFGRTLASAEDFYRRQMELLEDLNADDEEALRLRHERELAELQRAQAAALAEVGDDFAARLILETRFTQARAAMEERHVIETRRAAWEATKAEIKQRQDALAKRQQDHAAALDNLLAMERENMTPLERLDADFQDFLKKNAALTEDEKARAFMAYVQKRQDLLAQEAAAVEEAAQAEREARRETMRSAIQSAQQVLASIAATVSGVAQAVGGAARSVGDFLGRLVDYAKRVGAALGEVFATLTGGAASVDAIGFLREAMDAVASGEASGSIGEVAANLVREMAANAQTFLDGLIAGLPTVISALLKQIPALVSAVATALPIIARALADLIPQLVTVIAENVPVIVNGIAEALPIIIEAIVGAIPGLVAVFAENVPVLIQALVDNLPPLISALASAIPQIVQVIAESIPVVVQAFVAALPELVTALIASLPMLVDAFVTSLPIIVDGLIEQLPRLISAVMEAIPSIAQAISDAVTHILGSLGDIVGQILGALPQMITGILDAIPQILSALFDAIPVLIEQVIANLPAIVQALLEGLLAIIIRIAEELPVLVAQVIELIPDLVRAIVQMLPDLITAIIQAIPSIISGVIDALPRLLTAIILLIPELVFAVIEALPQIISALVVGLFTEIIFNLPELIKALAVGLFQALRDAFVALGQMIVNAIKAVFKVGDGDGRKGTDGKDDGWLEDTGETIKGWFSRDKSSNYSGISFVPATMRGVTLHKGEAVLTADENSRRLFGGAAGSSQSNPGAPVLTQAQGGGGTIEALFAVDGRVVDGVLLRASATGKGQMSSMMRRKAGVRAGVKTANRFNFWR